MKSFFDLNYITPEWFVQKKQNYQCQQHDSRRRQFMKSAAGVSAIAALPTYAKNAKNESLEKHLKTEPWLTLNSVLEHLLPNSETGPGAKEINAIQYLLNVVYEQRVEQDEIDFIFKGVGWLNGYSQSQNSLDFQFLNNEQKEVTLKGISQSRAGENWLNTLLIYLFEAMLSPPSYGGNPDGTGWKWLEHQAGFPLPNKGDRYYEIPVSRSKGKKRLLTSQRIKIRTIEGARKE